MSAHRLVVACLVMLGASGCSFFLGPSARPPPTVTVQSTPELVARGEYLASHVTVCVDCHSPRLNDRFSMPPKPGSELGGGDCRGEELGIPGKSCPPNITSDKDFGVGGWTDGELMRAIREGVDRQEKPLLPYMPYASYRHMADEDLNAIIAYLRSLQPLHQERPRSEYGFFIRHVMNTFPEPVEGAVPLPARGTVAYGEYLATLAGCQHCHTQRGTFGPKEELAFGGGQKFEIPGVLHVNSANITPDAATGIGRMTREQFISRFKSFEDIQAILADEIAPAQQTIMPWPLYAGMTEEDLGAIYDYLRTVKPLKNEVVHFPEATKPKAAAATSEVAR